MLDLQFTKIKGTYTISSVELAEVCTGGSRNDHLKVIGKAKEMFDEEQLAKMAGKYTLPSGEVINILNFPDRESCLVSMAFSYDLYEQVRDAWEDLENELIDKRERRAICFKIGVVSLAILYFVANTPFY